MPKNHLKIIRSHNSGSRHITHQSKPCEMLISIRARDETRTQKIHVMKVVYNQTLKLKWVRQPSWVDSSYLNHGPIHAVGIENHVSLTSSTWDTRDMYIASRREM